MIVACVHLDGFAVFWCCAMCRVVARRVFATDPDHAAAAGGSQSRVGFTGRDYGDITALSRRTCDDS